MIWAFECDLLDDMLYVKCNSTTIWDQFICQTKTQTPDSREERSVERALSIAIFADGFRCRILSSKPSYTYSLWVEPSFKRAPSAKCNASSSLNHRRQLNRLNRTSQSFYISSAQLACVYLSLNLDYTPPLLSWPSVLRADSSIISSGALDCLCNVKLHIGHQIVYCK